MRLLPALFSLLPVAAMAAPLSIFTSVVPIQTIVERIGAENVEVRALVQGGADPHSFDPSPQQVAELSAADLYLEAGMPFEEAWLGRIRSGRPDLAVINLLGDIDPAAHTPDDDDHGHGPSHGHNGIDPHVWTSPDQILQMAHTVAHELEHLDPDNSADYRKNLRGLESELKALEDEIEALLAPLQHRRFLVLHPAWGYFADRFDLEQIAIEHEGKQPGARGLAALIETAKASDVRVVFVQPQADQRLVSSIAKSLNAEVVVVDPLARDVIGNLRQLATLLAGALKQ